MQSRLDLKTSSLAHLHRAHLPVNIRGKVANHAEALKCFGATQHYNLTFTWHISKIPEFNNSINFLWVGDLGNNIECILCQRFIAYQSKISAQQLNTGTCVGSLKTLSHQTENSVLPQPNRTVESTRNTFDKMDRTPHFLGFFNDSALFWSSLHPNALQLKLNYFLRHKSVPSSRSDPSHEAKRANSYSDWFTGTLGQRQRWRQRRHSQGAFTAHYRSPGVSYVTPCPCLCCSVCVSCLEDSQKHRETKSEISASKSADNNNELFSQLSLIFFSPKALFIPELFLFLPTLSCLWIACLPFETPWKGKRKRNVLVRSSLLWLRLAESGLKSMQSC